MSMLLVDLDHYYEEIAETLGNDLKKEVPKVLRSALSNTSRRVRKKVLKEADSRYVYQEQDAWKATNSGALKLKAGTKGDRFYTKLTAGGPMNELLDFMVSPSTYAPQNRPDALAAKVLSSGALKTLGDKPKPFITRFKSGHIAVVQRTSKKPLPVKKLLAPSVPSMVKGAGLYETAEELIAAELPVQIQKAIKRTLKKAGRA